MSPRFVLGRENVPLVAEVVNRSLKADCTDLTIMNYFLELCVKKLARQDNWPHCKELLCTTR